ncbi:MAG: hypothetical protein PWQ82_1286 [Thermosediminibacterales bacterium]|nr:hypothetical protein [Thermosediminibacterales bacterium]MDK2836617.1 hypothetical protein [Thermosediminibacterales bacterium]
MDKLRIIKTLEDIRTLGKAKVMSPCYLDYLEEYFIQLHKALGNGESVEEFSLEDHGYFVILEKGDNVRNLSNVGLSSESGGLLGCWPEFVEEEKCYAANYFTLQKSN